MPDPLPPIYQPPAPKQRGVSIPKRRLASRLAPIPKVYDREADKARRTVKKVAKAARKKLPGGLAAKPYADDQFTVRSLFSEAFGEHAGQVYSEPLEIEDLAEYAGKRFYWRADVDQFVTDPIQQLQGFGLEWYCLTAGWTFDDGAGVAGPQGGDLTYAEATSNPLVEKRVIKAPATITERPRFRVVPRLITRP